MFLCLLRLKCDCWLCWSPAVCCCLSAEFLLQILQSQSAPVTSVNIYLHRERGLSSGHHHTGGCSVVPGVTTDVCRDVECKLWQGTVWPLLRPSPRRLTAPSLPPPHCPRCPDRENMSLATWQRPGQAHPQRWDTRPDTALTLATVRMILQDCRIPPCILSCWHMTNVAEHSSIHVIFGVNDSLRDVKSAIFNKDIWHQKYQIQSNSLSWSERNKCLCVSSTVPPLNKAHGWPGKIVKLLTIDGFCIDNSLLCLHVRVE